jgi:hypothetical protein
MAGRAGRNGAVAAVVAAGLLTAGCGGVNRRIVVESNVPTATVYIDNKQVGAAPAHAPFEYYGYYTVRLVHPDYETLTERVHVIAPWYAYPPFDFLADVFWPFGVEDVRRYYFEMTPRRRPDPAELIQSADALRERGVHLPPSAHPPADDPGPRVLNPPRALPPPAIVPLPAPAATPRPDPAAGSPAPAATPVPAVTPVPGTAPAPVIPRVTP